MNTNKTLKDVAAEMGISVSTAWRKFKKGEISNAVMEGNRIIIKEETTAQIPTNKPKLPIEWAMPVGTEFYEAKGSARSNRAGTITPLNQYKVIQDAILPFTSKTYNGNNYISIRDIVDLVNRAYFNFGVLRGIIDLMTEFASGPIHLKGSTKKARKFFEAFFKKINLNSFIDEFFREYFRSGNVFIFRNLIDFSAKDAVTLTQVYGEKANNRLQIPGRYTILNPMDVLIGGSSNFFNTVFYQLLNDYELSRLRNPRTEEDKEILNNLPPEIKKLINKKKTGEVIIQIDPGKVIFIAYKKQNYEAVGCPMCFPVLEDLARKEEMKRLDLAVLRSTQQIVLLITTGYEGKDGSYNVNEKQIRALETIFKNESVGKVLICDFSTDAKFLVPQISEILTEEKYKVLERDIAVGLNNILGNSSEKFANKSITVEIFIERLRQARQAFLDNFLQPEIKKIAQDLGMKNFPEAFFEDFQLEDQNLLNRIYAQLAQLGILTPQQTFKAIETNVLPQNEETYLEEHEEFKVSKDKGLFQPIAPKKEDSDTGGRPTGTGVPKTSGKPGKIGQKTAAEFSAQKVIDNLKLQTELEATIKKELLKKHKLKELNAAQTEVLEDMVFNIVSHEDSDNWLKSAKKYVKNPEKLNSELNPEIEEIAKNHGLERQIAAVLYHSQTDE